VEHDLVRVTRRHTRVTFRPVVRDCVREDRAGAVERGRSDRARRIRESLEPRPRIFVPEVDRPVGAAGREGTVDGVELNIVHRVDLRLVLRSRGLFAVAFEGEVVLGILILHVLNRYTSLHGANGKAVA